MKTDPNALHEAFVELATTMPPNPHRLRDVRRRAARRRQRRMAAGAAVSVGAVAGAIGIAMVPRNPPSSLLSSNAVPVLPECASVPRPVPHVPTTTTPPKTSVPVTSSVRPIPPADPDILGGYKGYGVVSSSGEGALTLANFTGPGLMPSGDRLDVIVDSTTLFENRGRPATPSDITIGRRVAFAVTVRTGERNHLDFLDVDAVDVPGPSPADVPAPDGTLPGKGVIDAVPAADQLVVLGAVGQGDRQPLRLLLGPDTRYFRFESACAKGELVVGSSIQFSVVPNGDGTYAAKELRIHD